jgi:adenine-specific DNA-methyltransferase
MLNVIQGYTTDKGKSFEGLGGNMKYYRTAMISKVIDEDTSISDDLLSHIKEMVQLEHGISIDNDKYHIILTDEDADRIEQEWENYKNCKVIYVSKNVLLTAKQNKLFSSVDVKTIPDYYFENELREVGEIW